MDVATATLADAVAIGDLHARSFAATYPAVPPIGPDEEREVWQRRLRQPGGAEVIVARRDGRLVGFAYIGPGEDGAGHVHSLHVDPDLQRRGIGRRLLDEALRRFADAGRTTATLWAVTDNARARRFYERLGWTADGTVERQPLSLGPAGPMVEVVRYRIAVAP